VAGLTALVAAWHFTFQRLGIDDDRPWLVAAYLAGLFALWFLLAGIHPAFFSLLLVLYPQVFRHLRLARAIPAAVVLSVAVVWREVLASGRPLSETWGRSSAACSRWCSAPCSRSGSRGSSRRATSGGS
jgi:hypothetical protein